ncbi:AAA family ATPase [Enemella dayhoffiae]|uniref:AAA family ATPase n=1 Tax=Enemella dayhoffiae TaxID=2016507 RepID=A0A255HBH4_9ACTN|nr:AAA family ATPase [Enemella dayhoffiae]OYO24686.1 AAA family ATPase [Enemella dayhoffiae]
MVSWQVPRPVRRIEARQGVRPGGVWPHTIAAVRSLLTDGLELGQATVLVGENGSGKSTVVEAIAGAYGLNVEGGSTGHQHRTSETESALAGELHLVRGAGASRAGFFLRAETMHGLYSYLESAGGANYHRRSHGESFLDVIEGRCFDRLGAPQPGLYLFDEVESALSFGSSLRVLATLIDLLAEPGVQLVLATHSPVLAALPGATLLELDGDGWHEAEWGDLELVVGERNFLGDPQRFLRHL